MCCFIIDWDLVWSKKQVWISGYGSNHKQSHQTIQAMDTEFLIWELSYFILIPNLSWCASIKKGLSWMIAASNLYPPDKRFLSRWSKIHLDLEHESNFKTCLCNFFHSSVYVLPALKLSEHLPGFIQRRCALGQLCELVGVQRWHITASSWTPPRRWPSRARCLQDAADRLNPHHTAAWLRTHGKVWNAHLFNAVI